MAIAILRGIAPEETPEETLTETPMETPRETYGKTCDAIPPGETPEETPMEAYGKEKGMRTCGNPIRTYWKLMTTSRRPIKTQKTNQNPWKNQETPVGKPLRTH